MARGLLARGQHEEARRETELILARNPDSASAWHLLGLCLYTAGDPPAALKALEKAGDLDPGELRTTLDHAALLRAMGQPGQALEVLERKRALHPRDIGLRLARAETLCRLDRGSEAVPDVQDIIHEHPSDGNIRVLLAECLEQGADFAGALEALKIALQFAPTEASPIHRRRARIFLRSRQIEEAKRELKLAETSSHPATPQEQAQVRLALADLAALEGNFTLAADQARAGLDLDAELYMAWLHIVPGRHTVPSRELLEKLADLCRLKTEDPYAWPVFMAAGRAMEAKGQHDTAFRLYTSANLKRSYLTPYAPEARRRLTANIVTKLDRTLINRGRGGTVTQTTRPIFIIGLPRSGTTLMESILATLPNVEAGGEMSVIYDWLFRRFGNYSPLETGSLLSELPDEEIRTLANHWIETINRAGHGAQWLTDKLPDNFVFAGLCHMCFPDAPIIWMKRDPLDVAVSCYTTPFMSGQEHSNRLEWLGQYHRLYTRLMAHWQSVLPPNRIIPVEYEKLVREPEATTQSLFAEIGLPWDRRCLDFHRQNRPIATASLQQVRHPLNDSSIGRWRTFERHLGPLISALSDARDPLLPPTR